MGNGIDREAMITIEPSQVVVNGKLGKIVCPVCEDWIQMYPTIRGKCVGRCERCKIRFHGQVRAYNVSYHLPKATLTTGD